MKTNEIKRNDTVTLRKDFRPMSGIQFRVGDKCKFLGWHAGVGNLARLSRMGDNAKIIVIPADCGIVDEVPVSAPIAEPVRDTTCDAPHCDESGPSRFVETHAILAGKYSGTFGIHLTPAEEREYNAGMARLAEC